MYPSAQRGLDPARAAVEEAHAKGVFELRHGFRHRWLGHRKMRRGLGHASPLRDGCYDLQVLQLDPFAEEFRVFHGQFK
jgi:hypothetical protein